MEAEIEKIIDRYDLDQMNPDYQKNLRLAAKAITRLLRRQK